MAANVARFAAEVNMGTRLYAQREWRLLSWWLATYHCNAEILMNVRVGPTLNIGQRFPTDELERQAARLRNRWVDAIYFEAGEVNIVEAKMEPDPGVFSQLVHYARKFRADPTMERWKGWPINLVALVYHDDPSVAAEAPWYGVRWVVYQPDLEGFVPPQLRGGELEATCAFLPQDWPARISWVTGKRWGVVP
jgi:hypothetical protein